MWQMLIPIGDVTMTYADGVDLQQYFASAWTIELHAFNRSCLCGSVCYGCFYFNLAFSLPGFL